MSSDYLYDVECNGTVMLLTMRASGFAELTILESDLEGKEGVIASFPLIPNLQGLENAEKIAVALKAWSEHIKTANLVQEAPE